MSRSVVEGRFYDGQRSAPQPGTLSIENQMAQATVGDLCWGPWPLKDLRVLAGFGKIPSRMLFPNGASFEFHETENVPIEGIGSGSFSERLAKRFEARWRNILASWVGLIAFLTLFFKVLIPFSAHALAQVIPAKAMGLSDQQVLRLFARTGMIRRTQLPTEKQKQVEDLFLKVKRQFPELDLKLQIVSWENDLANAFALSEGQILLTDRLILLAENEEQLKAVLYHEIGHVHHHHAVEALIETSAISLMLSIVLGDGGTITLPTLLMTSANSRQHEREADQFAILQLQKEKIDVHVLGQILKAMTTHAENSQEGGWIKSDWPGKKWLQFLSTHPTTEERVEHLDRRKN